MDSSINDWIVWVRPFAASCSVAGGFLIPLLASPFDTPAAPWPEIPGIVIARSGPRDQPVWPSYLRRITSRGIWWAYAGDEPSPIVSQAVPIFQGVPATRLIAARGPSGLVERGGLLGLHDRRHPPRRERVAGRGSCAVLHPLNQGAS